MSKSLRPDVYGPSKECDTVLPWQHFNIYLIKLKVSLLITYQLFCWSSEHKSTSQRRSVSLHWKLCTKVRKRCRETETNRRGEIFSFYGGKIQSRQVARGGGGVPPVISGVIALLAVADFSQDPLSLVFLLCLALSPQPLAFSLPVGARQRGNLTGKRAQ